MAALPETVTYILIFNESDFVNMNKPDNRHTSYVHGLTDIVLLAMLVITSFLCNATLITTVASHHYLRRQPFYDLLAMLSSIFLVDCLLNGSLSLAYMSQIVWSLGYLTCATNIFVIQLVLTTVTWLILQAATDRYICLHHPTIYRRHMTIKLQVALTMSILAVAILVLLPYLVGFLPVRAFPARMACGAASVAMTKPEYAYAAVLLVLQTVLPGIAILVFGIFFTYALISDKHQRQRLQTRSWLQSESLTMSSEMKPILSHHDSRTLCVCLVMTGYYTSSILPYAVFSTIHQMDASMMVDDAEQQEICRTPNADVFLAWLRYLATWVHPVAVLALHDDIRQEALALLTSWKSSSAMVDHDVLPPASTISSQTKWAAFGLLRRDDGHLPVQADALTAVLFPSPDGLFLRHPIGTSTSQFDYVSRDNFSECCFWDRDGSVGHGRSAGGGQAVEDGLVNGKQLGLSSKSQSKKRRERFGKSKKTPTPRVVPKRVNVRGKPVKLGAKKVLPKKHLNPNASAIISAEPINTYRNGTM